MAKQNPKHHLQYNDALATWSLKRGLTAERCPGPVSGGTKSFLLSQGQLLGIQDNTDFTSLHLTRPFSTCLPLSMEVGTPEVNGSSGHVSLCKASPYSPTRPIKARKWTSSSSHSVLMCPQMYLLYTFNSSCSNEKCHVEHSACARWGN